MKNYQFLQKKYLANTYVNRGLTLVKGDQQYLYNQAGDKYLDLMTNYGVNILGYNHPELNQAITDQLNSLPTLHGSFTNDARAEAAEQLVKRCGHGLEQVYFSNSGSEAIETALKFAVLATGKKHFISAKHSFHGKSLGALSATSEPKYQQPFQPLLWQFDSVDYGDITSLKQQISDQTAAVILEPIQGEGGIIVPSSDYLSQVSQLCQQHNVLLIIDEIQTGVGRTGTFLAIENSSIEPSIVCLGKGLAGGLPVGATLVNQTVGKAITKGVHSSTFGSNPLTSSGILATLNIVNQDLLSTVQEIGKYFLRKLQLIKSDVITDVRGQGLMIGMQVNIDRNQILKQLQKQQILAIPAGSDVVRFLPPYTITKAQIDQTVDVLTEVLNN